jgi:hypothetical protein
MQNSTQSSTPVLTNTKSKSPDYLSVILSLDVDNFQKLLVKGLVSLDTLLYKGKEYTIVTEVKVLDRPK